METGNISDRDDKVMDVSDVLKEEPMTFLGKFEHLLALEVLEKFSFFSTICKAVQADCLKDKENIDKHFTKNKKQIKIKDFLKLYYWYGKYMLLSHQVPTFFVFVYPICAFFIPSVISNKI